MHQIWPKGTKIWFRMEWMDTSKTIFLRFHQGLRLCRDINIGATQSTAQYTIGATTETVNCDTIVMQLAFMTMGLARTLT